MMSATNPGLQQIMMLHNQENWSEAISLFENWSSQGNSLPQPGVAHMIMHCYKKSARYLDALNLGRKIGEAFPDADLVKRDTAWCLYFHYFKDSTVSDPETAISLLEEIAALFPQTQGLHPLPLAALRFLSENKQLAPELIIGICALLNPDLLDTTPYENQATGFRSPSHKERYISYTSKALFESGDYSACLRICQTAIKERCCQSRDADFWLSRRIALCELKLGNARTAYDSYQMLMRKKRDWFIIHEAAICATAAGEQEAVLTLCCKALLADGKLEYKIKLLDLLASELGKKGHYDAALLSIILHAALRSENGWALPKELLGSLKAYNIDPQDIASSRSIFADLKPLISVLVQTPRLNALSGTIKCLLPSGNSGFIAAQGKDYFFRLRDCRFPPAECVFGLRVSFVPEMSFDPKKQRESEIATNVTKE